MEHIRVSNMRCLADSTAVQIKPITLLVGANSSGKSTFLRLFPLLRQSHEMRTLGGLVLNEGDVDFGFFSELLHKDANPAELRLEFGFTLEQGVVQGSIWNNYLAEPLNTTFELTYVKRAQDPRYPRLRTVRLTLEAGGHKDLIDISADDDGKVTDFRVNEFEAGSDELKSSRLKIGRGIAPLLFLALNEQDGLETDFNIVERRLHPFSKRILNDTNQFFHGRTAQDTRLATFEDIRIGSPEKMLQSAQGQGVGTWRERVRNWHAGHSSFQNLRNLLIARRAGDLLDSVSLYISGLATSIYYFQPVRANVQRDYISRDVSVTSVNSTGLNVAMVLASMSSQDQRRFREWMQRHFGFEIFPQGVSDGARVSLRLLDSLSKSEYNLADTGFGFSQMLPFLVQIWNLIEGRVAQSRRLSHMRYSVSKLAVPSSFIIAIEQPELHLHPALQARLADLIVTMVNLSREKQLPVRFILETHSQTIIERMGQSVECKALGIEDVQVLLFELDRSKPQSNTSLVKTVSFDQDGILVDWPFGFLSATLPRPMGTREQEADAVPN